MRGMYDLWNVRDCWYGWNVLECMECVDFGTDVTIGRNGMWNDVMLWVTWVWTLDYRMVYKGQLDEQQ